VIDEGREAVTDLDYFTDGNLQRVTGPPEPPRPA
jgi:hypothetical protein